MTDSRSPLRLLTGFALPLRLGELLWDGQFPMLLDRMDNGLYHSAMKQMETQPGSDSREVAPAPAGATLFGFLAAADRLYERIAEALARVGLSYAKYEVLKRLSDANGPVSLGALAESQHCARSNITQLIDRLEAEGLVRRVDDPGDRRGVRAELTPVGSAHLQEGVTQIDLVRAQFAAFFSAPERAELGRLLAKVQ